MGGLFWHADAEGYSSCKILAPWVHVTHWMEAPTYPGYPFVHRTAQRDGYDTINVSAGGTRRQKHRVTIIARAMVSHPIYFKLHYSHCFLLLVCRGLRPF